MAGAHEIDDGQGHVESKGGGDTARSLVQDDETRPLVDAEQSRRGSDPPLPGTVGAEQDADGGGDAKAGPSDTKRSRRGGGRSRSKDGRRRSRDKGGRRRSRDKDGRRRRKRRDKDKDKDKGTDLKGRRRKKDTERLGSKRSFDDANPDGAPPGTGRSDADLETGGRSESKGQEAGSTQRDSLPPMSPQGTVSARDRYDDGGSGSGAGSDRPLLGESPLRGLMGASPHRTVLASHACLSVRCCHCCGRWQRGSATNPCGRPRHGLPGCGQALHPGR